MLDVILPSSLLVRVLTDLAPQPLSYSSAASSRMRIACQQVTKQRRADLSRGTEAIAVRCENNVSNEPFPNASYSRLCFSTDPRLRDAVIAGCDCRAACDSTCGCCAQASLAYESGRLRCFSVAIIECHSSCRCDPRRCPNRVVSRGLRLPLVVFKTHERGWGLRCSCDLLQGEFVCEYAGELISSAEAAARVRRNADGSNYVMSVREHTSRAGTLVTTIDPSVCGNVGRYINHSCDPNLVALLVRAGSFVPRVAFFCLRDVQAGEELTFSYGEGRVRVQATDSGPSAKLNGSWQRDSLHPKASATTLHRPCLCMAQNCKGLLPYDE